jgi:hypothetical protein
VEGSILPGAFPGCGDDVVMSNPDAGNVLNPGRCAFSCGRPDLQWLLFRPILL